jgi:hypothetical protein
MATKRKDMAQVGALTAKEQKQQRDGHFEPHIWGPVGYWNQRYIIENGYFVLAFGPTHSCDCSVRITWADGVRCDVMILVKEGCTPEEKWSIALERGAKLARTLRKVGDQTPGQITATQRREKAAASGH